MDPLSNSDLSPEELQEDEVSEDVPLGLSDAPEEKEIESEVEGEEEAVGFFSSENIAEIVRFYREDFCAVLCDSFKVTVIIQMMRILNRSLEVDESMELFRDLSFIPLTGFVVIAVMRWVESYSEEELRFELPSCLDRVPERIPMKKLSLEAPFIAAWLFLISFINEAAGAHNDGTFLAFEIGLLLVAAAMFSALVPIRYYEDEFNDL